MKKIIFSIIGLIIFTEFTFSWDPDAAKFFPMAVGNSWTYVHKIFAPPLNCMSPTSSYNFKISITGDTVFNGHRYYKFSNNSLYRLDSTSMNVYKWSVDRDCLSDSLLAKYHDWVTNCYSRIQVHDTSIIVFAGQKRQTKMVSFPGYSRGIMYGIGLYYEGGCEVNSGTVDELKGCVINGVIIGDTTTVPVNYDNLQYLPLAVGNVWVYKTYKSGPSWICYAYEKYTVTGTLQINSKTYYTISNSTKLFSPICSTWVFPVAARLFRYNEIRIDSITANIYGTDTCLVDSLGANEGDSIKVCNSYYGNICDTSTQLIFGYSRAAKTFIATGFETSEISWYIKDFGFVRYHYSYPGPAGVDMLLTGCVLNGIVYGDTNTMVGINNITSEIPERFELFQNYPNPFNPTTKIRFAVPPSLKGEGQGVRVIVYDALGREVQTLVKEQLQPGTYEVEWDGSNFASGVYYYTLSAEDYFETKKMVLIK